MPQGFLTLKGEDTDGGTEENPTLKDLIEGVTTLDPLGHASTATDVLSLSCMKYTQTLITPTVEGLYSACT